MDNFIDHFLKNVKNKKNENFIPIINFNKNTFEKKEKLIEKSKKKIIKDNLKYNDFLKIHQKHLKFVSDLLKNLNKALYLEKIYRIDLTGSLTEIYFNKIKTTGILVEERKNVLVLILENDSFKIYPKKKVIIKILIKDLKFTFIGKNMSKKRFLKK